MSQPPDLRSIYELAATAPLAREAPTGEPGIYAYDFTPEGLHKWRQAWAFSPCFWTCARCGRQGNVETPLDLPVEGCPAKLDPEDEDRRLAVHEVTP